MKLSIRTNPANPNHHLWNNHGRWFVHYVIHPTPYTKERVRRSLRTASLAEARRRRDALLKRVAGLQAGDAAREKQSESQIAVAEWPHKGTRRREKRFFEVCSS